MISAIKAAPFSCSSKFAKRGAATKFTTPLRPRVAARALGKEAPQPEFRVAAPEAPSPASAGVGAPSAAAAEFPPVKFEPIREAQVSVISRVRSIAWPSGRLGGAMARATRWCLRGSPSCQAYHSLACPLARTRR